MVLDDADILGNLPLIFIFQSQHNEDMTPEERAAAARATGATVAQVTTTVENVSTVVRNHVRKGLSVLGPAGALPMAAVDAAHKGTYSAIRASAVAVGEVAAVSLAATAPPDAPSVADGSRTGPALAVLGAAFGDRLPPALAPRMRWQRWGDGGCASTVVIFVHGLGGHEDQWGERYAETCVNASATPVTVRYTTGQSIDASAAEFAATINDIYRTWPTHIDRLVFVAHSMGGLVATRALHIPASADTGWHTSVTDVITLGSPFQGAPLERVSDRALRALALSPTAAPIAELGHTRSQGIKDLGPGIAHDVPANIRHHAIVAMVGESHEALSSVALGDGIVPVSSAQHRRTDPAASTTHLPVTTHLDLLDDVTVATVLDRVLRPPMGDNGQVE